MRNVSSFSDVNIVIRDLQNQITAIAAKNLDKHGTKITNAGQATDARDYVTLDQLSSPEVTSAIVQMQYRIVFSTQGVATTGMQSAAYNVHEGNTGTPVWVSVSATVAPSTGDLHVNVSKNGVNLLTSDLILPMGKTGPVKVGNFITPTPHFGLNDLILPVIVNGAAASFVTVQIAVNIDKKLH